MDYDLNRLGDREFEHLSQALAVSELGSEVHVFGDGPDGGREASFEGTFDLLRDRVSGGSWQGYGVLQAKYRRRPEGATRDAGWFVGQVRTELEKWSDPGSNRVRGGRRPEFLLLTTNVVLSPAPRSGGIDVVDALLEGYAQRLGLRGWEVWHYDKLCRLIDVASGVRTGYRHFVTPGDVLSRLLDRFPESSPPTRSAHPYLREAHTPLPGRYLPAQLLNPRYGVVPFLGRSRLLGELVEWCERTDIFSVALIVGQGGSGKTRLATELCSHMRSRRWDAGMVDAPAFARGPLVDSPSLLVFDYSDQVSDLVKEGLAALAHRPAGPPVRVLLLARHATGASDSWWSRLADATDQTVTEMVDLRVTLEDHPMDQEERMLHAERATRAFADHLGSSAYTPPDVAGDDFASPLLVHMAALLAAQGDTVNHPAGGRSTRETVLAQILGRERRAWTAHLPAHRLEDLHPSHANRAVLVVSLVTPSRAEIFDLLKAFPEFADPTLRSKISEWLSAVYPDSSIGPDLLAEELHAQSADLAEVVSAIYRSPACGDRHLARLLQVLGRGAERREQPARVLGDLFADHIQELVDRALANADGELAGTLNGALWICWLTYRELNFIVAVSTTEHALGPHGAGAAALLVGLTYLRACATQLLAAREGPEMRSYHVGALIALGERYADAGRYDEALTTTEEAVVEFTKLDPNTTENLEQWIRLAFQLFGCLSVRYAQLGRHDDAVQVGELADGLAREFTPERVASPSSHAQLLSSLAGSYSGLGKLDKGLAAATEAKSLCQQSGGDDSEEILSGILFNIGSTLRESGRDADALRHYREALSGYRRLAAEDAAGKYLPDLAQIELSIGQTILEIGLGRRRAGEEEAARSDFAEARVALEEASELYWKLSLQLPDRFNPEFNRALCELARCHVHLGFPVKAVDALRAAAGLLPDVESIRNGRRYPWLEKQAGHLVDTLSELGLECDDVRSVARDVLELLRGAEAASPGILLHPLARSLHQVAYFDALGGDDGAILLLDEASATWSDLVSQLEDTPGPGHVRGRSSEQAPVSRDAIMMSWTRTLSSLTSLYNTAGHYSAARAYTRKTVEIWRELASIDGEHRESLARSLVQLGYLAELIFMGAGVPACREALTHLRAYCADHPDRAANTVGVFRSIGDLFQMSGLTAEVATTAADVRRLGDPAEVLGASMRSDRDR
ncbi:MULTISPECIES: tetratricopeptide repeat protein [Pseudofrankia]|uniref:tetratricopeptide repeat protein n=1 Tax=Pseudofrankia TaxID=2994363 RepID=UPI000234BA29|nr:MULTISPECIES: tetratricopeptide repeat protein [Pseudofrankia]OHV40361.1 hypothetical protein BCD49_39730 [Pseudofrankia sp. EUN1h]